MEKQIVYKNIEQYWSQNATHKEFPSKTLSQQENAEMRYWNSNDWLNCQKFILRKEMLQKELEKQTIGKPN